MVLAIMAFIAGRTVFTPISHGSSNQSPVYCGSLGGNIFKVDDCHIYDMCHEGIIKNHKN